MPVVVEAGRPGLYVLVYALMKSPKQIVMEVLTHLCNETTVERDVILPIPMKVRTAGFDPEHLC